MDKAEPSSYRPISNLPVVAKLLECLVARQLVSFLAHQQLPPSSQSDFRRGYSTEKAITRVLSELLETVDRRDTAILHGSAAGPIRRIRSVRP